MKKNITFTINDRLKNLDVDIRHSLLDVIREEIGITSTKEGCGVGECGACSVLIDDVLVDACIYMAVWADGKTIRTAEGESKDGKLSTVQKAYIDEGAVQCGFCTPGLIMASTTFVEKQKCQSVTKDDIRKAHAGNICRCTGYKSIINAVEKALNE
jgi:aerobic-type carbon monoxide dehydrogenase small subunit (CoxS/CutS family)